MPVPPKTPRSPMTPNSQAMTNNVLLDGSLSERRKSKIPIELWVRGIALLGVLLIAVLLVMHGSRNLSLKDDVIPKISNPVNFFIFNAVVTSFAVIPGAASATCVAAGVIFGAGFGTIFNFFIRGYRRCYFLLHREIRGETVDREVIYYRGR